MGENIHVIEVLGKNNINLDGKDVAKICFCKTATPFREKIIEYGASLNGSC